MEERDDSRKENFVMSGKYEGGDPGNETYRYPAEEKGAGKRSVKPILIAGAGLLIAVVVVLMFLSGAPRSAEKDLIKGMEARLKQVEEKLGKLEWIDTGLARLDRKEKELAALSERMTQMESSLGRRIDQLAKDAAKPAPAKVESAAPPKTEAAPPKPPPPAAKVEKSPAAKVYVVQKGDTLYGISRRHNVPVEQLLKLNNMSAKDPIRTGQKLTLGPAAAR
ncbi:MAG: LysM peptidoglycan-binding domain-containing protein [Desulfobacterales bacterium]|jgi:LysM repeat protein|nr:LysM peptidoglycan-binding domain-containing protein [Desulfobacterales bacterium]